MKSRTKKRVAFVLVNWNTRDLLLRAVATLQEARDRLQAEITVVDNASSDGSADAVARLHPKVDLIRNRINTGFSYAANQGIDSTSAPVVCIMNPDLDLEVDGLERCLRSVEANRRIGALGPLLRRSDGQIWQYRDRYPTRMRLIADALLQIRSPGRLSEGRALGAALVEVDWLAGACVFLRRSALNEIGPFDERFFLYKEDVDLCLRLTQAGYLVARDHGTILGHAVAASTRGNPDPASDRANWEGMRSTVLYAKKQMGSRTAVLLVLALRVSLIPRILKAGLLIALTRREQERRKCAWMCRAWRELGREISKGTGPNLRRVA